MTGNRAAVGVFVASARGLGYLLAFAQSQFNAAHTIALIVPIMAFVLLLFALTGALERLRLRWRYGLRRDARSRPGAATGGFGRGRGRAPVRASVGERYDGIGSPYLPSPRGIAIVQQRNQSLVHQRGVRKTYDPRQPAGCVGDR